MVMLLPDATEPLLHGGDIAAAQRQFPSAPEPFIDLSTGINPYAYPIPHLDPEAFRRLPERTAIERLCAAAARAYGAPSYAHVAAAPGTQILLPTVATLLPRGRAVILAPTYSEHARAARLAGHEVTEVGDIQQMMTADAAIVVNPNNPDGRIIEKPMLLRLAEALRRRGGWLVVDEAFMDVAPAGASLAGEVGRGNIIVLRSFGKFFGLAGLRLGFALAAPDTAARITAWFGPWGVSGPAIAIGEAALADRPWAEETRQRLAIASRRLDTLLAGANLHVVGGTTLFRFVQTTAAAELFDRLGRAGILVRCFEEQPTWLRFGLCSEEHAWTRLAAALSCTIWTGT